VLPIPQDKSNPDFYAKTGEMFVKLPVMYNRCAISDISWSRHKLISNALTQFPNLVMQIPAGFEWLILVVLIVVIFFGVKKIPQFARSFGKASSEYEKAKIEAKRELQQIKNQEPTKVDREKLEAIAETLGIDYADKNSDDLRTAIEAEIAKGKKT
jgi:sec-independent protein translocase protein TatA